MWHGGYGRCGDGDLDVPKRSLFQPPPVALCQRVPYNAGRL